MRILLRLICLTFLGGLNLQAQWVYGYSIVRPDATGTKYLGLAETAVDYVALLNYSPRVNASFLRGGVVLQQKSANYNVSDGIFFYASVSFETPFSPNSEYEVQASHSVRATQYYVVGGQGGYWDPGGFSQFGCGNCTGQGGISFPFGGAETVILVQTDINLGSTLDAFLGLAPVLCEVAPSEIEQGEAGRLRVLGYFFDDLDGSPAQLSATGGIGFTNTTANDFFNELESDYAVVSNAPPGSQSLVATTRYGVSRPLQIRVVAPRGVQLSIKSNGQTVSSNQCAYITEEPAMPNLEASLLNGPASGTVSWYAQIQFTYLSSSRTETQRPEFRRVLDAGQAWNLGAELGNLIYGGTATITATSASGTFQSLVCIRGRNPPRNAILDHVSAMSPVPRWYFPRHIYVESSFKHFKADGFPSIGTPSGYGLSQVDPVDSPQDLWNWRQNLNTGGGRAELFRVAAANYWLQAVNRWTGSLLANPMLPSMPDRFEGTCSFSLTPNGAQYSFADALAIQAYNTGLAWFSNPNSTVPYVAYHILGDPRLSNSIRRWNLSNWTNARLNNGQQLKNCYVKKHCYIGYPASSPPVSLTIFQGDPGFQNPGAACDARGNQ